MNLIVIIILLVVFITPIIVAACNKVKFFDKDKDNLIQIAANVAVICTLIYGVYSYTFNIYPVFEKEEQLKDTELKLADAKENLSKMESKLQGNEKTMQEQEQILSRKEKEISEFKKKQDELSASVQKLAKEKVDLDDTLKQTNSELIFSYMLKEMNQLIIRGAYSLGELNLKQELLDIANEQLKHEKYDTSKYKAYTYLKNFANEKLKDNENNIETLSGISDYYFEKEKGISIGN